MRWIAAVALCVAVSATARAGDWGVQRDPFDPQVVQRYKQILAHDPHDEAALRQLVALYKSYRTAAQLEAEYRAKLGTGEDWATLVVLARLAHSQAEALALWKRAMAAKPEDAIGWLATGDAAATDAAVARDAYRRAAQLATVPRAKRAALTKLISAARTAGDRAGVDAAYVELIGLAPKDGALWLERGNAQLDAKQPEAARTSFATAEPLLQSDPERQLTAIASQGMALDALGRPDEAIAQYERGLDKVPSGYSLGAELVSRIVDTERRRGQLASAIARFEKRWPERARGYFEWATLADLYEETHDTERAIAAYKRAVAKAPTEVTTQRKLIALLDQVRPAEALAQHEAAARLAPGDADLQLALAKRYHASDPAKAFATLEALARRMNSHVNVRTAIAAQYEEWSETRHAIVEYEALAVLEPSDPEHLVVLGDAYWRVDDQAKALAAWQRLDKIGTADALFRHGDVLALHESWEGAADAYTKSLARNGTNVDAWYGLARANDALGNLRDALDDARRAVALTGVASQADGLRYRQELARVLGHAYTNGERDALRKSVARWRFAFDHRDAAAGYMLAAHHARIGSYQLHDVLVQLYRLVPNDDSLGIALARSFVHRRDFGQARAELTKIERRTPARADEMRKLIEQVNDDEERAEREIRFEEEGRTPGGARESPDLVGRARFGTRLEVGTDVHAASGALLAWGVYRTYHVADGTAFHVRFDWSHRIDPMEEENSLGLAGTIATRIVDARKFELAIGIGPRAELRYGYPDGAPWGRGGLAGDVVLELLPRALATSLELRFDQNFTDSARSSALLLELGFEVR